MMKSLLNAVLFAGLSFFTVSCCSMHKGKCEECCSKKESCCSKDKDKGCADGKCDTKKAQTPAQ